MERIVDSVMYQEILKNMLLSGKFRTLLKCCIFQHNHQTYWSEKEREDSCKKLNVTQWRFSRLAKILYMFNGSFDFVLNCEISYI